MVLTITLFMVALVVSALIDREMYRRVTRDNDAVKDEINARRTEATDAYRRLNDHEARLAKLEAPPAKLKRTRRPKPASTLVQT